MRRLFYVMAFLKKFHCPCVWIPLCFVGNSLLFWLEKAVENLHLISDEFGIEVNHFSTFSANVRDCREI